MQKVMIIGRLGRDPELKYTQGGDPVANFSVAVDESYKDKGGNKVDAAEWFRCVAWGKLAEIVANHCRKGRQVYVEGRMKTRKWQDKDGADRSTTELQAQTVTFLDSPGE